MRLIDADALRMELDKHIEELNKKLGDRIEGWMVHEMSALCKAEFLVATAPTVSCERCTNDPGCIGPKKGDVIACKYFEGKEA